MDNSVSQKFYKDKVSRSRHIQVRRKSILVSNTKLSLCTFMLNQNGLYSTLASNNNHQMKTILRNVLEDITAHCGTW